MISIDALTFTYPNAAQPALRDVSLQLPAGTLTLVVGSSGAGKSTLLRCLNGLVPHFTGGHITGRVRVNGLDPIQLGPQHLSQHVGFVFQDPDAQFVMDVVEDEIAFALENAALPRQDLRVRVEEVLDLLGLTALRTRKLETLSGGERQRVAIASALALRPRVLVLDEPTSQLDPQSAEDVLNALVRLNADLGLTVVLSEHRLERVLPFIDTLVHVTAEGVRAGAPREMLGEMTLAPPLIRLAKALRWQPLPLTIKEGRQFSESWPIAADTKQSSAPRPNNAVHADHAVIEIRDLHAGYGNTAVLKGVTLSAQRGEVVALLGRNGSGKSTLLKSIVGLIKPQRGAVHINGANAINKTTAQICREVGYLPQDPSALLFADTVQEELAITLRNHQTPTQTQTPTPTPTQTPTQTPTPTPTPKPQALISSLLQQLGLSAHAHTYPRDLSTGERQRVAFGAVAITQPKALLLDEPTRGLDYENKQQLLGLLRSWQAQGAAIVLVTHDVELMAEIANRVVLLSQGKVIADGAPAEVLGASPLFAPQVARLFPGTGWLTLSDVLRATGEA
jgi:energy-coupling factor transport system ATP-binding protein